MTPIEEIAAERERAEAAEAKLATVERLPRYEIRRYGGFDKCRLEQSEAGFLIKIDDLQATLKEKGDE